MNFIRKIQETLMLRRINKAVVDAGKRMAKMSPEELKELEIGALNFMYPKGWWQCACKGRGTLVIGKGATCPLCKHAEPNSQPIN